MCSYISRFFSFIGRKLWFWLRLEFHRQHSRIFEPMSASLFSIICLIGSCKWYSIPLHRHQSSRGFVHPTDGPSEQGNSTSDGTSVTSLSMNKNSPSHPLVDSPQSNHHISRPITPASSPPLHRYPPLQPSLRPYRHP